MDVSLGTPAVVDQPGILLVPLRHRRGSSSVALLNSILPQNLLGSSGGLLYGRSREPGYDAKWSRFGAEYTTSHGFGCKFQPIPAAQRPELVTVWARNRDQSCFPPEAVTNLPRSPVPRPAIEQIPQTIPYIGAEFKV